MFTIDIYIKNKRLGVLRKRIELLEKVAATYSKCRIGIANGLTKNQRGKRFSNSIAKNNNSHIQNSFPINSILFIKTRTKEADVVNIT